MKGYSFLFLIILWWNLTGCKNPASETPASINKTRGPVDTLILAEQRLVVHWGKTDLPAKIYPLNEEELMNGYAIEFKEDGRIYSVSGWENGVQQGSTYIIDVRQIIHKIFDSGSIVYEEKYLGDTKDYTRLYPQVVEEFFFEDKYYAKIRFPLPYAGELKLQVEGYQAVIGRLPDQTFQLVINDALDLTGYDLELTYQPAVQDSLLGGEYGFKHVVYAD